MNKDSSYYYYYYTWKVEPNAATMVQMKRKHTKKIFKKNNIIEYIHKYMHQS